MTQEQNQNQTWDVEIIDSKCGHLLKERVIIGTPTLGIIRIEWHQATHCQIIPPNWANGMTYVKGVMPVGFFVQDAQNIIVKTAVEGNFEWLILHEDDVLLPFNALVQFDRYMQRKPEDMYPVVSGLYYLKAKPTEPVLYRGRGTRSYRDFKLGDLVWVDGVPTGCLLINCTLLRLMWNESPEYIAFERSSNPVRTRKVFSLDTRIIQDPISQQFAAAQGTSDLQWCSRVMKDKILERCGFEKFAKEHPEFPFLCDTNINCGHIDLQSGRIYPQAGL